MLSACRAVGLELRGDDEIPDDIAVQVRALDAARAAKDYDVADTLREPFDVVLALGGLYHVADPPYILRQLRAPTNESLLVQTSGILQGPATAPGFMSGAIGREKGCRASAAETGSGSIHPNAFGQSSNTVDSSPSRNVSRRCGCGDASLGTQACIGLRLSDPSISRRRH